MKEFWTRDWPVVTELHLDHAKATDIEGLTNDYSSLELLSLSTVGLEKLDGLPELPSLKMLDLSSNSLSGGLEGLLRCPNLEQLNLSANKLDSLDELTPLAKLSSLKKLDLFDCAVSSSENYRKKVFALIPNLVYLDGLDHLSMIFRNDNEEPSDQAANGEEEDADGERTLCFFYWHRLRHRLFNLNRTVNVIYQYCISLVILLPVLLAI
ncbi:unnamed protein product [Echinostoma caproni]|uniref:Uncharacterized protein n=1 Tax=Echinostoma caproni TaxID=27848 RepID=A0A3P8HYN9_9TREM|nr:unnamed protein product [Echinostoma caproni]